MEVALTNIAGTGSCGLQLEDEAAGDDTEEVLTVEGRGYPISAIITQGTVSINLNLGWIHIREAVPGC